MINNPTVELLSRVQLKKIAIHGSSYKPDVLDKGVVDGGHQVYQ